MNVCRHKRGENAVYGTSSERSANLTVRFYANTGTAIPDQKVLRGEYAVRPADPAREGYTFLGWFESGAEYDFSTPVVSELLLIAHWRKNDTSWICDETGVHFSDVVAKANVVWKDAGNATGARPPEVTCLLTERTEDGEKSYPVTVRQDAVFWKEDTPGGAVLSRGGGPWTVKISGLSSEKRYMFLQIPLTGPYMTQQIGTTVVNTVSGYDPAKDDTAWLTARNARLYDAAGNLVVLQGIVTWNAGVGDFDNYFSIESLKRFCKAGVNCLRVTVQLVGNDGTGYVYLFNGSPRPSKYGEGDIRTPEDVQAEMRRKLDHAIRNATALGMYLIVDWGILGGNPNQYLQEAKQFFGTLAAAYRENPYVLFEICNEPVATWGRGNGDGESVKAYGEEVIRAIRATGSRAIIILAPNNCGTHLSNRQGDDPIHDPLCDDLAWNVCYTFHCYPANYTYENWPYCYAWRVRDAVEAGLTVLVTEFSPMDGTFATADALSFDMRESAKYLRMFREWDVGYCYFKAISNTKNDATYHENQMFRPHLDLSACDWSERDLTECGKWFYRIITGDGVLSLPDYTAEPQKKIRPAFASLFTEYGLSPVYPGFAVNGEQTKDGWCMVTGSEDTISEALYRGYCKSLYAKAKKTSDEGICYQSESGKPFAEEDLPQQVQEKMLLSYLYCEKTVRLSVSFGKNPVGEGYGILLSASDG